MTARPRTPANETAHKVREPRSFGKRREPATITITRGGRARHFTVNPVIFPIAFSVAAMFVVGYLMATAYLVFRDDLIGAARAHNNRLLHEYEDRIAALRSNLDRVISRQLLDQQAIEAKIAELMRRQEMLKGRSGRVGKLVEEARKLGLADKAARTENRQTPPETRQADPVRTGSIGPAAPLLLAAADGISLRGTQDLTASFAPPAEAGARPDINNAEATRSLFSSLAGRIEMIDNSQRDMIDQIRLAAAKRAGRIAGVMAKLNVPVAQDVQEQIGGPYIPIEPDASFESHVEALDVSLTALGRLTARLDRLPIGSPVAGKHVSSGFGTRIDPFLGSAAMHSGIDFAAMTGTPVRASAAGTVTEAGRNGGYGNMVEIDHGGGISSRYGHMSKIVVKSGDRVTRGTVIGLSGSTGRSTGPHLHYEIRREGVAIDPARFVKSGREIAALL